MKKEVISLFVDGEQIKVVQAKSVKGRIKILSLESITLKSRLEQKERIDDDRDPFGLELGENETEITEEKESSNNHIIYEILNKYYSENTSISVNLPESNAGFVSIENTAEKSKRKLKKYVAEEIERSYSETPDEFSLLPGNNRKQVAVFQRGNNPILDVLEEIRPFLGKNINIELAEVNEIALINQVNRSYNLTEEVSVIIYVGVDFSRILFMKGSKIIDLIPVINEGYSSDSLLLRLYGKIMLERDESSISEFDNILLAGEASLINGKEYFEEKFPDAKVDYISFDGIIDVSELEKNDIEYLPVYTIPISSALRILEPKQKHDILANFLPRNIKERQKKFKIAWHGLVFLIALCTAFIYFFGQHLIMERKIKRAEYVTSLLNEQIVSAEKIIAELDKIENRINNYQANFALYDSLTSGYFPAGRFLEKLCQNVKNTNSIWLNSLELKNSDFTMSGESMYRTRIPKFVSVYDEYKIKNVNTIKIRNREVLKFNINGKIMENDNKSKGK